MKSPRATPATTRLQALIRRKDRVLSVLHPPTAALWDFMEDFRERGVAAWDDFVARRTARPYPVPEVGPEGEGAAKQRELEERYFSAETLQKYTRSTGGPSV